jgi:membrane-bound inhibitor of C-type lysozyme
MRRSTLALLAAAIVLSGCGGGTKEEVPSPDTFECTYEGARWLVRFTQGEARLLSPDGERTNLYQIPAASGVRYSNGMLELRGKGTELVLISDGVARPMLGCKPLMIPKEEPSPMLRIWQPPPTPPLGK